VHARQHKRHILIHNWDPVILALLCEPINFVSGCSAEKSARKWATDDNSHCINAVAVSERDNDVWRAALNALEVPPRRHTAAGRRGPLVFRTLHNDACQQRFLDEEVECDERNESNDDVSRNLVGGSAAKQSAGGPSKSISIGCTYES
jgi:hypothetical protein